MNDDEVLQHCRTAKNSEKFVSLFDHGDTSEYGGNDSSADYALIGLFKFFTQDEEQIDCLMRQSALVREKYDSRRGDTTWLRYSIHNALGGSGERYSVSSMTLATTGGKSDPTALPDYGNGAALMTRQFTPLRFLVPGILTEGAFLLVGAPKIGKSWFALWLAASVARGGVFLGKKVEQGDVLYLALEDNDRRLKDRLTMLGMTKDDLNHFTYQCEWPQLGSGGEAKLEAWLEAHPETRLVVVDILKKIRPKRKGGGTGYDDDYDELSVLQRLALKHRTTFLIVHHSRKMKSDDILEEVSGTMGTTGAVDGVLTLKRPSRVQRDGTLYVTGRDLPDDLEVPVELGKEQPRWERKQERFTILDTGGMKIDFTPTPNEAKIMQALQERGATSEEKCVSAVTLVELTELSERTVKGLCSSMRGHIKSKTGRGGGYWLTTSLRENV